MIASRNAIEQIILDFPGYGYRRETQALQRAGWMINSSHEHFPVALKLAMRRTPVGYIIFMQYCKEAA